MDLESTIYISAASKELIEYYKFREELILCHEEHFWKTSPGIITQREWRNIHQQQSK